MAQSLGVNGLQTRCSGLCPITLQETSRAGDKAIRMTDNQCYYISAISDYVKRLIRRGINIGNPDFVLPTRSPITLTDLNMLNIQVIRLAVNPAPIVPAPIAPAPMPPMAPYVPPPPRPPGAFDPNRFQWGNWVPPQLRDDWSGDDWSDDDARALRRPTKRKRIKRTKRARKRSTRK